MTRINTRALVGALAVVLLAATFFTVRQPEETKSVTAFFPRAVSVYVGTEVRILGVNVGRVTAVVPQGNSVRVEMEYDAGVDVPADAKAAIVTPTLVADRFVQLTPAYSEGDEAMADGAEIALPDTGIPVELDRIYAGLRDLSQALGPNGVNKNGTLDNLLRAGAEGLEGQGAAGNQMIRELSAAAETFGEGAGPLFDTVTELATFTETLAANDEVVRAFMKDLAGVSSSLVSERAELQAALDAVARAVGTVESFVKDNRQALVGDVEKLTRVVKTINSEKDSIDTALKVAPVAIGNLTVAFNNKTGSIGSRIGIGGNIWDADGLLCGIVQQSQLPRALKDTACTLFKQLIEPITSNLPYVPPASGRAQGTNAQQTKQEPALDQAQYLSVEEPTLAGLVGGPR
jgi:phospholipid/cholesterol/gamma-HCH transport system substrate-binding protein